MTYAQLYPDGTPVMMDNGEPLRHATYAKGVDQANNTVTALNSYGDTETEWFKTNDKDDKNLVHIKHIPSSKIRMYQVSISDFKPVSEEEQDAYDEVEKACNDWDIYSKITKEDFIAVKKQFEDTYGYVHAQLKYHELYN